MSAPPAIASHPPPSPRQLKRRHDKGRRSACCTRPHQRFPAERSESRDPCSYQIVGPGSRPWRVRDTKEEFCRSPSLPVEGAVQSLVGLRQRSHSRGNAMSKALACAIAVAAALAASSAHARLIELKLGAPEPFVEGRVFGETG